MSQGLTWIAGRRIPLLALVALTALTVGLFAALQSASAAPSVALSFNDSDAIVADGTDVGVTVTVSGVPDTQTAAVDWIRVSGELDNVTGTFGTVNCTDDADTDPLTQTCVSKHNADAVAGNDENIVINPTGSANGEYTVSAQVTVDGKTYVGTKVLTIGDPGTAIDSAELALANEDHDSTKALDADSASRTEAIYLTLTVSNSLGEKTDNRSVLSVNIIAAGGSLGAQAGANGTGAITPADANSLTYAGTDGADADATSNFAVSRATAGTLDVYAVVVGASGATTSNVLTLTWTGDADQIALGDASGPLGTTGSAYLDVTAEDSAGNTASLDSAAISASVLDNTGSKFAVSVEQAPAGSNTFKADAPTDPTELIAFDLVDCDGTTGDGGCDPNAVRLTIDTTSAAAGEHTLEVKLGALDTESATIIVAGNPATISVESTSSTVSVGDVITVTASVVDEDGNPVVNDIADGTTGGVEFTAAGSLKLTALDKNNRDLKNGESTARFVITDGSGSAIIIATYKSLSATTSASAAAADAPAEDVAPADGLSQTELNNFASWSGEGSVSASELLAGISGASAVLFYDGDSWQRYGAVDGQVIPGSRDFTIRSGQTIWISG